VRASAARSGSPSIATLHAVSAIGSARAISFAAVAASAAAHAAPAVERHGGEHQQQREQILHARDPGEVDALEREQREVERARERGARGDQREQQIEEQRQRRGEQQRVRGVKDRGRGSGDRGQQPEPQLA